MRRAALVLLGASGIAHAGPTPLGPLWQSPAGAVVVTSCAPGPEHGDWCRGVAVRAGGRTTILGSEYAEVRLLWRRHSHDRGPDVLVLGDTGGSGSRGDLFAVTLAPRTRVVTIGGQRMDALTVRARPLRLALPFDLEYFNGAPHAGAIIVPLPVRWAIDGWVLDRGAVLRPVSSGALAATQRLLRAELERWHRGSGATRRLYPPEASSGTPDTGRALVALILAGHADAAHRLLLRAWPLDTQGRPLRGADAFWASLCRAVVTNWPWQRFGLTTLPHARLVEESARAAAD